MAASQRQLRRQADLDPLTGLLNRPAFVQQCEDALAHPPQQGPISLILLDLDFFTEFSETFGHRGAEHALQHVAAHLGAKLRDDDVFCRLEGESFALLMPGATSSQAERLANRLVTAVNQRPFTHDDTIIEFTASAGFAQTNKPADFDALHHAAASALLQAKRLGHNRAVGHTPQVVNEQTSAATELA